VPTPSIEVLEAPPTDLAELERLLAAAAAADGHQPLGEQKRLELHGKGPFLALVARQRTGEEPGAVVGLAQIDVGAGAFGLEVVVDPAHRKSAGDGTEEVRRALVTAARDEVERRGGGALRYWIARAGAQDDAVARSLGFVPERELLQLRVDLQRAPHLADSTDLALRPFRPGLDEAAWLAVNARAFADHPEQGRWNEAALSARESEAWFDPNGFLVADEAGRIAGSCWTKLHRDTEPLMGEIYVISVDPDFQKRGLGRRLSAAGLDWLARAGARIGMLYVDASNEGAVAMYRSLGFSQDHADRCYVLLVPPA
jgi:mycothiol synthase